MVKLGTFDFKHCRNNEFSHKHNLLPVSCFLRKNILKNFFFCILNFLYWEFYKKPLYCTYYVSFIRLLSPFVFFLKAFLWHFRIEKSNACLTVSQCPLENRKWVRFTYILDEFLVNMIAVLRIIPHHFGKQDLDSHQSTRTLNPHPDPHPHQSENLVPDPHLCEKLEA